MLKYTPGEIFMTWCAGGQKGIIRAGGLIIFPTL
jgi:hypothetical protein